MTIILNDETFIAAVREAAAERGPDYVYDVDAPGFGRANILGTKNCVYSTPEGEPACLFGLALSKISPELMPEHDFIVSIQDYLSDTLHTSPESGLQVDLSETVLEAAAMAQCSQDIGAPYGEVIAAFEEAVK